MEKGIGMERWRRHYLAMEARNKERTGSEDLWKEDCEGSSQSDCKGSGQVKCEGSGQLDYEGSSQSDHVEGCQMNGRTEKFIRQTSLTSLAALVIGVIFVVLAGAIFATTTWRIMPDSARVLTILVVAGIFFLASVAADRGFQIHKTANACYLLGCTFLFLTVIAAGYFGMLDRIFVQETYRWWRVLSLGSLVMEAAMLLGIRRFSHPHYTMVCCLGVTLNVALFLEALGCSGQQFVSGMALYASLLTVLYAVAGGKGIFALLHLCISGWFLFLQCVWDGFVNLFIGMGRPAMTGTVWMNLAALAAVAAASGLLAWKRSRVLADNPRPGLTQTLAAMICQIMTLELVHYGTFSVSWFRLGENLDLALVIPAVLVTVFFFAVRRWGSFLHSSLGDGLTTLVLGWDTLLLAGMAGLAFHDIRWQASAILGLVLFTSLLREWGKCWTAVRMLLPLPLWYGVVPGYAILSQTILPQVEPEWLCLAFGCGLMVWDFVRKDVFAPVIALVSVVSVCTTWLTGDRSLEVAWMAASGIYVLGFTRRREYRKQALVGSMVLLTLAFERQPWMVWPEILRLEMFLLPLAADLYLLNFLWDDHTEVESLQTVGYVLCLAALTVDALMGGEVADALILEGICLVIFLLSHLAGSRKWMCISGGILVMVVVYMTRDFWLSIAWWVYLLTAGMGLILFAAVREKRRNQEMDGERETNAYRENNPFQRVNDKEKK